MKCAKVWKTIVAGLLFSLVFCLFTGMEAAAEENAGDVGNGFQWAFDSGSRTLTVTGKGDDTIFPNFDGSHNDWEGYPWDSFQDQIDHVVFRQICEVSYSYRTDFQEIAKKSITMDMGNGFSWTYDVAADQLIYSGNGKFPSTDARTGSPLWKAFLPTRDVQNYLKISDGITALSSFLGSFNTVEFGKDLSTVDSLSNMANGYIIPENHPYFSLYDDCVYSKDYSQLFTIPMDKTTIRFHPDLKILSPWCLGDNLQGTFVLPWGLTTIQDNAFAGCYMSTYVIPDTAVNLTKGSFSHANGTYYGIIFSKKNSNAVAAAPQFIENVTVKQVDSVMEYYPDISIEQKPESSQSASQPSSQPKPESKPSQPTSQPSISSKPVSSTPAVSSKPSEQSKPAESSAVESSGTGESSLVGSSREESSETVLEPVVSEKPSLEESEASKESSISTPPEQETSSTGFRWLVPVLILLAAAAACAVIVLLRIQKNS